MTPGPFWRCECGHPLYEHGRILDGAVRKYTACGVPGCRCELWRASDGSEWPRGTAGARIEP